MRMVQEDQGFTIFWAIVLFIALIYSFVVGGVSAKAKFGVVVLLIGFAGICVYYYFVCGMKFSV